MPVSSYCCIVAIEIHDWLDMTATSNPQAYSDPYGILFIFFILYHAFIATLLQYTIGEMTSMLHLSVTVHLQYNPHLQFCITLCNGMGQLRGKLSKTNDIFVINKILRLPDYAFDNVKVSLNSEVGVTSITASTSSAWSHFVVN